MFASPRDLPDELLPYSGKLSDRFYEVRQNVAEFCAEIKAMEDAGWPEGSQEQLKAKARERNLWNFFLPEVSGITVMEYSPIAGALPFLPRRPPPNTRTLSFVSRLTLRMLCNCIRPWL